LGEQQTSLFRFKLAESKSDRIVRLFQKQIGRVNRLDGPQEGKLTVNGHLTGSI